MKPQIGDIWRWSPYTEDKTVLLLVVRYYESSQTYLCVELGMGSTGTYCMDTDSALYGEEWERLA